MGLSKPISYKEGPSQVGLKKLRRGHSLIDVESQRREQRVVPEEPKETRCHCRDERLFIGLHWQEQRADRKEQSLVFFQSSSLSLVPLNGKP